MLTSLLQGKRPKTVPIPALKIIYTSGATPLLTWEIHHGPNWYLIHHSTGADAILLATLLKSLAPQFLEVQQSSPEINNEKPA